MELFNLTDKKALVTGGSRGLGRGMAEGLLEAGGKVVIVGTNEKVLEVANEYNHQSYDCTGIIGDLSNAKQREEIFEKAVEILGGIRYYGQCCWDPEKSII